MIPLLIGLILGALGATGISTDEAQRVQFDKKLYLKDEKLYMCEDIYEKGDTIIREDR